VNCLTPFLLRRCMTLLLAGLLSLGPFLHSHFGASHNTGFHLDGVHAVHAVHPTVSSAQSPDDESPALGVATSMPHSEDDGLPILALALLMAVLPLVSTRPLALPKPHRVPIRASAIYRAGLPPPPLAPPAC